MKQVFLSGAGQVAVFDVPLPGRLRDSALVRNACSLISTGTEGAAVTRHGGLRGLYEKAVKSRERLGQVWQLAQKVGYRETLETLRSRLGDYTPLGYSTAGQVLEVDGEALGPLAGRRVACMGTGFANHAEYAVVPQNLLHGVPEDLSYEQAAFAAPACIAMQGIRRLELAPGERVGVIGLGLIGQICIRLLGAMGYQAFGMDLSAVRAEKASEVAGVQAWGLNDADSPSRVMDLTSGRGLDGVVVCAATRSDDPANLACDLCRLRGRVVIVGDVGLGLSRQRMYAKEIELRLSCSYGPGRYDAEYEVAGRDYPYGHVRWTEKRNLEHFVELAASGRLDLRPLVSNRFPVERAPEAYAALQQSDPNTFGVLLDYGPPEPEAPSSRTVTYAPGPAPTPRAAPGSRIAVGLVGIGGYAKAVHVPNLRRLADRFELRAIASRSGGTAGVTARRWGVPVATSDYRELLADPAIDAVIVATRHAGHAQIVLDALDAGKHVFVEKPMTTTIEDGERVLAKVRETGLTLRVGFNRRFSPHLNALRRAIGLAGVRMLSIRVSVGSLGEHWSNTVEEGGRLLGEGCHFLDLCNWFVGAEPLAISAVFAGPPDVTNPNAMVGISYPDGSSAQVIYTTLGHPQMPKEYCEAFGNGRAVRSEGYREVEAYGASAGTARGDRGDKGQLAELEEFAAAIHSEPYAIQGADARAGLLATWMALAAYQSAWEGKSVRRAI